MKMPGAKLKYFVIVLAALGAAILGAVMATLGTRRLADIVVNAEHASAADTVIVQGSALTRGLDRERAVGLSTVRLVRLPENGDRVSALLSNGTLYQLVLEREAVLLRYDLNSRSAPVPLRIPLIAPKGHEPRSEYGMLRVATGTAGLLMGVDRRGWAWWEEAGPAGRLIEFRIEGDSANMVPPSPALDDPRAPVRRRFNITPSRELSFRILTGAFDLAPEVPRVRLGRGGFQIAVARAGVAKPEAVIEIAAVDIAQLDARETADGQLRLTIGFRPGGRGEVAQFTYDTRARRWLEARSLALFPQAQTMEVADVGESGVLAILGLPWNISDYDPETGLYWIRPGRPVAHLLTRVRKLHAIALPEGFVALFQNEFRGDEDASAAKDVYVLRGRGEALGLYRFLRPGPCSMAHLSWLGGDRFVASFCSDEVVFFEVPPLEAAERTSAGNP